MLSFEEIRIVFYVLAAMAVYNFLKYKDEFVILLVYFFYSAGIKRYQHIVVEGKSSWTVVKYARDIFHLNNELALIALNLIALGTFLFSASYILFNTTGEEVPKKDDPIILGKFVNKQRYFILTLFLVFLFFNGIFLGYTSNAAAEGASAAFGISSYAQMFQLAIGGIIILTFLVYRGIRFDSEPLVKTLFLALIILAAYISYNPLGRFSFLSWSIAIGIMVLRKLSIWKKVFLYTVLVPILGLFFAYTGNTRYGSHNNNVIGFKANVEAAYERMQEGEDENMLDGMMMLMQVYPEHLGHAYGMDHIEILLRPIPRAWWAGKPLGSYINKIGLTDNMQGGTVGISPSIYGTFYAEGAIPGIILFSLLYGYLFVRLFRYSDKYDSGFGYILRGTIFASMLAILRGGDLPGIMAFIGMTYWPLILFINRYSEFIAKYRLREKAIRLEILKASVNRMIRKNPEDQTLEETEEYAIQDAMAQEIAEQNERTNNPRRIMAPRKNSLSKF